MGSVDSLGLAGLVGICDLLSLIDLVNLAGRNWFSAPIWLIEFSRDVRFIGFTLLVWFMRNSGISVSDLSKCVNWLKYPNLPISCHGGSWFRWRYRRSRFSRLSLAIRGGLFTGFNWVVRFTRPIDLTGLVDLSFIIDLIAFAHSVGLFDFVDPRRRSASSI